MNLNKIFIIGNLTRDPELRTLPSGASVANFGVATNRIWMNSAGEKQQDTQFHNVVIFGKQAETASRYLKKGSMVFIEGRIQTRNWQNPEGVKQYRTEIVAERMQLGPRKYSENTGTTTAQKPNNSKKEDSLDTIEYPEENNDPDAIPF